MLDPSQIDAFDRDGLIHLDAPFAPDAIAAAAEAVAGLLPRLDGEDRRVRTNDFQHGAIAALIGEPWIEAVARDVLRADAVELIENAIVRVHPMPGRPFSFWEHIDARYTLADLDATPRRIGFALIVWLTDVDPTSAPMMVRPGSHRTLGAYWAEHPSAALVGASFAELPRLAYPQPVPCHARAGQVTLCVTAAVHGGSVATGPRDRRSLHLGLVPRGFDPGFADIVDRRRYLAALRANLDPRRRHLIPDWTRARSC
ncbi:MAG TPA: phytanoyl-CoA dioxygenase family protein [Planctomycetota bacterium]|nr:phytanoyl-CoA dioxygenase family protein [Planctomycetota bacterium]